MIENLDVSGKSLTKTMKKKKKRIRFGLNDEDLDDLKKLLKVLEEVEQFYNCIGGVIGYQITVMELLAQSRGEMLTIQERMDCQFSEIHAPRGLDLNENAEYAAQAALWGIQGLLDLGEIYPLGGAADRLGLVDADTDIIMALKGTTRPTRYHVLLDDVGFSADDLQELVHSLSYVYQRSTTAISVVAPICYAHLAASHVSQFVKFEDAKSLRPSRIAQLPA